MSVSQIAHKLRLNIAAFSGELSKGLPQVARRFVGEMLYGIQASQSVHLTQIGRALDETISLKKTHERLCRQIGRGGLGEHVERMLLKQGAARVGDETLLILDLSDLCKKYARRMQYMARIRDGSDKTIGNGYWTLHVVGVESQGEQIVPLALELYSHTAPGFVSENDQILSAVEQVSGACAGRGIWVMDRGGDRRKLLKPFVEADRRFLVRLVGTRHLIYRGRRVVARELAASCPMHYAETIVRQDAATEKSTTIEFGYRRVRLPGVKKRLSLVVVNGFGREPMMLLTTEPMKRKRATLWWAVGSYLTRWKVEETIRYIKDRYQLEDIRLLRYGALRTMMALLVASTYFAAVWLGRRIKMAVLARHALRAAKRLFGIPDFRYYALSDGICAIFARSSGRGPRLARAAPSPQLTLPLPDG